MSNGGGPEQGHVTKVEKNPKETPAPETQPAQGERGPVRETPAERRNAASSTERAGR